MHDLLAHERLVELRDGFRAVFEFEPFLQGQEQVGVLDGGRGHVRLLMDAVIEGGVGFVPFLAVAHHAVLVARLLPAYGYLVRLAGFEGAAHRRKLVELPLVHGLVLVGSQARHLVVHELPLFGQAIYALLV